MFKITSCKKLRNHGSLLVIFELGFVKNDCGHECFKNKSKNILCEKAYYTVKKYSTDELCCYYVAV